MRRNFLTVTDDGNVSLNPAHKYATQINAQMAITGAQQGVFRSLDNKGHLY